MAYKYTAQKELEDKAGERLKKRWDTWSEYFKPYWEKFKKINDDYFCEQDETPSAYKRSKLKYPQTFTLVESIKPITYDALVGDKPYIGTEPRNEEDDAGARAIQGHQSYMLDRAQFPITLLPCEHDRQTLGTTFAYVPWILKYGLRRRNEPVLKPKMEPFIDPVTGGPFIGENGPVMKPVLDENNEPVMEPQRDPYGNILTEKVERDYIVEDNIDFQWLAPWSFVCDPTIVRAQDLMNKGEGCIRRWHTSPEALKDNTRKELPDGTVTGVYPEENVKECLAEYESGLTTKEDKERGFSQDVKYGHKDSNEQYKNQLCLMEGWLKLPVRKTKFKRKKDGEDFEAEGLVWDDKISPRECVVTMCVDTGTVLRVILNPTDEQFRPFLGSNAYMVPGRLMGLSFPRVIRGLVLEIERLKNTRLDYLNFILNRPWIVNVHSGIQVRDSFNIPDRIIKAKDINGLRPLEAPDYGGAIYRDLGSLDYEVQNASGVLSANQDTSKFGQAFGETATGVSYFSNMVGSRIALNVKTAEHQMLVPLGKILFYYAKQFVSGKEYFRVANSDSPYQYIDTDSYAKMIDFIPVGASDRISRGQMVSILDRFLTILPQVRDLIRVEEVIKDYVKLTRLAPNPNRYMISDKEKQERAAAMQPEQKGKVSISLKGEDIPPEARMQLLMQEYGIQPRPIPNLLNPQGMPAMPGQLVDQSGFPIGGADGARQEVG